MILYNDFDPFNKIEWVSCDTETFTYIDGEKVTNDTLLELGKVKPAKFFREHATVRVWAWEISDGEHFFVTNNFDEFIAFFGEHKIKAAWFYNAKFDFAQIDYQLLTHKPVYERRDEETSANTPFTYSSLHNDKGGRFSLKVWTPYRHSGKGSKKVDRHERTHAVTFYDFCNIFGGGLARLLKEFKVVDFKGNKIRKLKMDYQQVDEFNLTKNDFDYLQNDTKGLYHLIRIANDTLFELTGYEITGEKPDVMTAGGLAKKVLLKHLYPALKDDKARVRAFQKAHPLTLQQDKWLRDTRLYGGGLCIINPRFQGYPITNRKMFRYDVNSEYPFIISRMDDLTGKGQKMSLEKAQKLDKSKYCLIYVFSDFHGWLLPNKVACFRDPFFGDFVSEIDIEQPFSMFEEELEELEKWYELDFTVACVLTFKRVKNGGYNDFVQTYYELKKTSKKAGERAKTAFAKLLLNSSYGKLAERVSREICYREINDESGAVHVVHTTDTDDDVSGMLSVVQGAYVTSQARIWLLSHIREICGDNVAENFVYCDTDSVHTFCEYANADAYALGGFKNEGSFNFIKYVAPKCYFDGNVEDGRIVDIEFHTKGLSARVVLDSFLTGVKVLKTDEDGDPEECIYSYKTPEEVANKFSYGEKFQPLCGMNIRGGKALIPLEKYLAKPSANPLINCGGVLMEE